MCKPEEALQYLDLLEEKRRKAQYVTYWKPYPEQRKIFDKFTIDKKVFGLVGGNRSGKTISGAAIAVAWALGKEFFKDEPAWDWVKDLPIPEPPNTIWIVGLDFAVVRDVIWHEKLRHGKDLPPFLPKIPGLIEKLSDGDFQVRFTNGSLITCKSADSGRDKFQGASVDLVWIDEECEADIFDECFQRTADCAGKLLLTLTPLTDIASGVKEPWVYNLYEKWKQGKNDIEFVSLSVLDNPFVPEIEKERLKEKWSGHHEERARLYGEFVKRAGLVYNTFDESRHLVKPFRIPNSWRRIASIDPASTGTTAVVWGAIDPGNNLYIYREYYESDKIISDHAKDIMIANCGDPIDVWLIDPKFGTQRNPETHRSNIQLYKDAGIPARLAPIDADFGLNASREYINATVTENSRHPKLYIFNDCYKLVWEVKHYVWAFYAKGDLKGQSKDKPLKRNDHAVNAMQYLCSLQPKSLRAGGYLMTEAEKRASALVNSYTAT